MRGRAEVRGLDLASLKSARAFAAGWDGPIDLLINSAASRDGCWPAPATGSS